MTPLTSMVVTTEDEEKIQPLDDVKETINTAFSLRQRQQRFRIPMFGLSANYYDPPRHFGFMPMYNSFPKYFHPINVPMRKLPPISPTTITKKPFRRTTAMTTPRTTTMTTQRTTTMTTLRTTTMTTPRTTTIGTRPPKRQRRAFSSMFVVRIFGINEPLCIDDTTLTAGQRYELFESPYSDIFVYGHIGPKGSGSKRNKRRRKQATYFDSISVTSPTHALNFHIDSYLIDGTSYSWTNNWFSLSDFNPNITFPLVVHRSQSPVGLLRCYADLSSAPRDIRGLMGYFAGLKGKVIKRKTRKGKIIGKIKIRHVNTIHKYKAKLLNNPLDGVSSCWFIKKFRR